MNQPDQEPLDREALPIPNELHAGPINRYPNQHARGRQSMSGQFTADATRRRLIQAMAGSVALYVGPATPEWWEGNWIDTAGKRPMPLVCFYGASDALFDTDFRLPDFEEVR